MSIGWCQLCSMASLEFHAQWVVLEFAMVVVCCRWNSCSRSLLFQSLAVASREPLLLFAGKIPHWGGPHVPFESILSSVDDSAAFKQYAILDGELIMTFYIWPYLQWHLSFIIWPAQKDMLLESLQGGVLVCSLLNLFEILGGVRSGPLLSLNDRIQTGVTPPVLTR